MITWKIRKKRARKMCRQSNVDKTLEILFQYELFSQYLYWKF